MDNQMPEDPFTEDETDAVVIGHRITNDTGARTSLDDVLAELGFTRADLEAEWDAERERQLGIIDGLERILGLDASLTVAEVDQLRAQIAELKDENLICHRYGCRTRICGFDAADPAADRYCDDHHD